jgi:hypothetical protein
MRACDQSGVLDSELCCGDPSMSVPICGSGAELVEVGVDTAFGDNPPEPCSWLLNATSQPPVSKQLAHGRIQDADAGGRLARGQLGRGHFLGIGGE